MKKKYLGLAALTLLSSVSVPLICQAQANTNTSHYITSSVSAIQRAHTGYNLKIDKIKFVETGDGASIPDPYGTIDAVFTTKEGTAINKNIWSQEYTGEDQVPTVGEVSDINIPITTTENFQNISFTVNVKDDDAGDIDDILGQGTLSSTNLSDTLTFEGTRLGHQKIRVAPSVYLEISYHVEEVFPPAPTWPDGSPAGWKDFAGQDLNLLNDPENALFGDYVFYSEQTAAISKAFKGKEAFQEGKYRVTVYAKGIEDATPTLPLKVSLKKDSSSGTSRDILLANPLSSGEEVDKGYYKVSKEFTVEKDETTPLMVVQNYQGGYIAGIFFEQVK